MAVTAFVLMKVKSGTSEQVAEAVADIPGVKLSHSVMGPYDVVLYLEGPNINSLRDTIMKRIQSIPAVRHTTTLLVV